MTPTLQTLPRILIKILARFQILSKMKAVEASEAEASEEAMMKAEVASEEASEEASEAAAVASLVREERVVSTDQKVEINPDPMTASIPEAEVVREGLVLLVATVEEMPHRLPLEYHREIFENYDL